MSQQISIRNLLEIEDPVRLAAGIDDVFFTSSNTKSFASDAVRSEFRERWLGRYLTHDARWFYVALAADDLVAGYLAGCLDDPAVTPRFADMSYYQDFAAVTRQFPAHLHVNLGRDFRSHGIGTALIARFANEAATAGAAGVHVITSRGARNVGFYERNGFSERAALGSGDREVVFLGRHLA